MKVLYKKEIEKRVLSMNDDVLLEYYEDVVIIEKTDFVSKYFKLLLTDLCEDVIFSKEVVLKYLIKSILNETNKRFNHNLIKR